MLKSSPSNPEPPTIAYLGPDGSFTHEAAEIFFSDIQRSSLPCSSIHASFEAVRTEAATYAVVPVESLRQGPVIETYMELKKAGPCRIIGEVYLPIKLFLIVHKEARLDAITRILSKGEAIRQCGNWLEAERSRRRALNLPTIETEEISSTAKAAVIASEDPASAGIGSRFVTKFYDVNAIGRLNAKDHEGIQDLPDGASYTRFLVLGRSSLSRAECAGHRIKTSFSFILSHRTGSMVEALIPFRNAGISMEEIQPMPFRATRRQIEYVFFMDFIGHIADESMIRAVREAEETCAVEYLGSYPCGEMPQAVLGPSD
jgi:chorismate mutase/prephenate dehydratase